VILFSRPDEVQRVSRHRTVVGLSSELALAAMAVLLICLGILPGPLLTLIQKITQ